ncbi:MAG: hypothetical protein V4644_01290 [Patescibacteria group bacterium]
MFKDWSSYAFIRLEGREGMELEILVVRPLVKDSAIDFHLPGSAKNDSDEHSVDTLLRAIYAMTGLRVKPDRVRRIKLPNKGRTKEKSHRLRFYLVSLRAEQFLDRESMADGPELEFITISNAISLKEHIEPHGDLIRLAGL